MGDEDGSYLLILDQGRRVVAVHPHGRDYGEITDTTLEHVVGRALRMVSNTGLVKFHLDNLDELVSLHLSGIERVWGFRMHAVFHVLWWDPHHRVCPSLLKHT